MKKNPKEFTQLQQEYYETVKEKKLSENLCRYVWDVLISANKGYGFNASHTLAYSIVGLQEANLSYHYPVIYWNCANLISDSGGEDGTVNYGKIAAAVSRMRKEGISIVPPYVNETKFGFKPDADNDKIVYGLKAINGVGATQANAIVANQPYTSMNDFYEKMTQAKGNITDLTFGDTAMISLIKAGAFDEIEGKPRVEIMRDFIFNISKPIKKLTMSNIEEMYKLDLLTESQKNHEWRYYQYRKFICQDKFLAEKAGKTPSTFFYKILGQKAETFFYDNFENYMTEGKDYKYSDDGKLIVKKGSLDKVVDKLSENFINEVLTDKKNLDIINKSRFNQVWNEKADGSVSRWEMESMNYYYHEHELDHVDRKKYGIVNFNELGPEPEIEEQRCFDGKMIPRFKLVRICGTVIDKDANHNTVTLLTPDGVVVVRLYKGQFSFYAKEIAVKDVETGKKTTIEKSWFKRGKMLLVTGVRQGDQFIPRQYKDSIYKHSIQLIKEIDEFGNLTLISERENSDEENKDAVGI